MPADDDDSGPKVPLDPLPRRPTPSRAPVTREVTSITRPLFTVDESAEDSVIADAAGFSDSDSGEDDDSDLFDAVETVAEVNMLRGADAATRVSAGQLTLTADRNAVSDDAARSSDDDDADDDDDQAESERTMLSIVVPEHLQDSATGFDQLRPVDMTERSVLEAAALDPAADVADAFISKRTELLRASSRTMQPVAARPGWLLALIVFGVFVLVVVLVIAAVIVTR